MAPSTGRATSDVLLDAVRTVVSDENEEELWAGVVGAWSFVHGFATLWLNGNFYPEVVGEPATVVAGAWQTLVDMVVRSNQRDQA